MQKVGKNKYTGPLTFVTIFLLTFYIYADFGIPRFVGYACLLAVSIIFAYLHGPIDINSNYKLLFYLVIIPCAVFSLLPNSLKTKNAMAITIFMLASGVIVLLTKTERFEIERTLRWFEIGAIILSLYIISVKIAPSIYWDYISPIIVSNTREYSAGLIRLGYGVPVGGSTTYADYIISIALLSNFSRVMFGKVKQKISLFFIIKVALFLVAIMFENRRSEIITLIAVLLVLFFMSLDKRHLIDFMKKIAGFIVIVAIMAALIIILYRTGHLSRFEGLIQKLQGGDSYTQDVTSGRLALWKIAWGLFRENPVFGIGWEQFINHNLYEHDVHNVYIQWLCETGVVGFILIFTPTFILFLMSFHHTHRMIRENRAGPEVLTIGIVGLGLQLYFLIINIFDAAFYHLNYFCFFALAVILSDSARKLYLLERRDLNF